MARAPFQAIVIPFVKASSGEPRYGVFKRRTHEMWQAISGGGEDAETPLDAAKRETFEEAGIADRDDWVCLQSRASIPASLFSGTDHWAPDLYVVPEYAFGLAVADTNVELSPEHSECAWLPFQEAHQRLTWEGTASIHAARLLPFFRVTLRTAVARVTEACFRLRPEPARFTRPRSSRGCRSPRAGANETGAGDRWGLRP